MSRCFYDGHVQLARTLIEKCGFDYRPRTLDALQLATAASLRAQRQVDWSVAADPTLRAVASLESIPVLDPGAG